GSGFQHDREKDIEGSEPQAVLAEFSARRLIESIDFVGDSLALEGSEIFLQLESNTPRQALQITGLRHFRERLQLLGDRFVKPGLQSCLYLFAVGFADAFVDKKRQPRLQRIVGALELSDLIIAPKNAAAARQLERIVVGCRDATGAHAELTRHDLHRSLARGFLVNAIACGVER